MMRQFSFQFRPRLTFKNAISKTKILEEGDVKIMRLMTVDEAKKECRAVHFILFYQKSMSKNALEIKVRSLLIHASSCCIPYTVNKGNLGI